MILRKKVSKHHLRPLFAAALLPLQHRFSLQNNKAQMKLLHTLFLIFFGLTTAFSQNSAFTFEYKGKTQNLDERVKMRKVNGMNMQIYRNGTLDTTILKGYADPQHKVWVTEHTLFQVGTMGGAIGNFLVLKAANQGKIKLENNVNDYLTSWKLQTPNNEIITVEQLIVHYPKFAQMYKSRGYKRNWKTPTVLQLLKGEKPARRKAIEVLEGKNADSFDQYSAPLVLQQMLEDVYKMPFAAIVAQEVLVPLGMTESTFNLNLSKEQEKLAAIGYTHSGRRLVKGHRLHPDAIASGLWTTPTDYAKFVFHVYNAAKGIDNSLISKDLAMKCVKSQKGDNRTYLFGVGENNHYLGGASYGYRTQFEGDFEKGNLIVIFLNSHENWQFLNIDCLNAGARYLKMKELR